MTAYLGSIWALRYFWFSLVRMDIRSRYRGSVLGMGWSLVHPIAMTIILTTVFSTLFAMNTSKYTPHVMSGLACWTFLQTCALGGSHCFFLGESYIRQMPAPLAIYPLRTVLACGFHFCLAMLLVFALTICVNTTPSPLALLSLVPTFALMATFGWAVATLFALANVRFRDSGHIAEVALQALYFLTPIIYFESTMIAKGLGWVLWLNPVVPFLNLVRTPVLDGCAPTALAYVPAAAIACLSLAIAGLALRAQERQVIFHL